MGSCPASRTAATYNRRSSDDTFTSCVGTRINLLQHSDLNNAEPTRRQLAHEHVAATVRVQQYRREQALAGESFTQDGQHWTSRDVAAFVRWMDRHCVVLDRTTILYRGTPNEVPYFSNAPSLTFTSTSRVRAIAAEFTRKKGFVHVLRCFPGCRVFDMEASSPASREREVVLLPGTTFVRRRRRGQTIYWDVRV